MHKGWLFLIVCVLSPVHAGTVYKWVDEHGVLHLSDQPHPTAERIELPETPLYEAPPLPAEDTTAQPQQSAWTGRYQRFVIETPERGETVRSSDASVRVAVALQPALQPGHKLRFYLDGTLVKGEYDTPGIKLQGVERGPHSVKAEVLDENGKLLGATDTVEFILRKESEITPKPPVVDPKNPYKPSYPGLPPSDKAYPPANSGTGKYPGLPPSDKAFPPAYQPKYDPKAKP